MKQSTKRILFAGHIYGALEQDLEEKPIDFEICKYLEDCQMKPNIKNCRYPELCKAYHFYDRYGQNWKELGI